MKAVSNFSYLNVSHNFHKITLLLTPVVNEKVFGKEEPKDPYDSEKSMAAFASTSTSIQTQNACICIKVTADVKTTVKFLKETIEKEFL